MILTGKQIIEKGFITKVDNSKCIQQVGVDVEIEKIAKVDRAGFIFKKKTILPEYLEIFPETKIDGCNGWWLYPGYYEITFRQGCKIPATATMRMRQRSSLLRSGAEIHSSIFDPGFETDQMGAFLIVHRRIWIEKGARIAQAYFSENYFVEDKDLYQGQFQKDKQRKE